jgi:hypothetical protein
MVLVLLFPCSCGADQIKKGQNIGHFLEAARKQISDEFSELRVLDSNSLMYIKEDLILPHSTTFYDFILTKARGKTVRRLSSSCGAVRAWFNVCAHGIMNATSAWSSFLMLVFVAKCRAHCSNLKNAAAVQSVILSALVISASKWKTHTQVRHNVFGVIVCALFLIALLCPRDGWFFRQDYDATFLRQKQTHFSVFPLRSLRPRQNLRQSTIGWLGECECECIVVECEFECVQGVYRSAGVGGLLKKVISCRLFVCACVALYQQYTLHGGEVNAKAKKDDSVAIDTQFV